MSQQSDAEKRIVDACGAPLPRPVTWRDRWRAASARTKVIAGSLFALTATTAVVLGNLQKIQDYFREPPPPPSVPPIVVEVTNSSDDLIDIVARGDFFLWLPGPDGRHTLGKYEFSNLDGTSLDKDTIKIKPNSRTRLLAQIKNERLFGQVLEQADCDVAFLVYKAIGGHRTTSNLPFTKDAIAKYCATVDIAANTPLEVPTQPNEDSNSSLSNDAPPSVTIVLPVGVIDTGASERKEGSTRAKGSYEIRFDGQKVLIRIDFDVRKSGVFGTGKGRMGLQILDANGVSLFKASEGLTVGADTIQGTASKDFSQTYTLIGEPVSALSDGALVAFNISADDSLGFPTTAAEWTQLFGQDVEDLMADLEKGESKEFGGWILKRIGK